MIVSHCYCLLSLFDLMVRVAIQMTDVFIGMLLLPAKFADWLTGELASPVGNFPLGNHS